MHLPIHKCFLQNILNQTEEFFLSQGQNYLCILYSALFSTAYFGLLRVGEITSGSHPVKVIDVQVADNKPKMLFILHTSKTHGKGSKPQMIKYLLKSQQLPGED